MKVINYVLNIHFNTLIVYICVKLNSKNGGTAGVKGYQMFIRIK